jgi:hypothetical protein
VDVGEGENLFLIRGAKAVQEQNLQVKPEGFAVLPKIIAGCPLQPKRIGPELQRG